MDVSYVELALDDGTTVYAVWDDSTEDYWYFDEEADDETVNAVTTADELHWDWDAQNNCWWFYDHSTDTWDWVWDKPELTTTVNWVWDDDTGMYWALDSTDAATTETTTVNSVTPVPLEAEWTISHD